MNLPLILGVAGVITLVMVILIARWAFSSKASKGQQQQGIGDGGGLVFIVLMSGLLLAGNAMHGH